MRTRSRVSFCCRAKAQAKVGAVPPGSGAEYGAALIPHGDGAWGAAMGPMEKSEVEIGRLVGLMAAGVMSGVPRLDKLPTGPTLTAEKLLDTGTKAAEHVPGEDTRNIHGLSNE